MTNDYTNPWTKKDSKDIYENPWIHVREDQVTTPAGKDGIYGVVEFKNYAIGIVPIDDEGNTWLVGQYRYPLDVYSWEIPMGGGPLEDAILTSAKRELMEETGLRAQEWNLFLTMHTSNSVTNETGYVFVAMDLIEGTAEPEETEQLQIKKLPLKEAIEMAVKGEITDSLSLAALLKLQLLGYADKF